MRPGMIYLGNGMYSNSGPNNYLMHHGIEGQKWGVKNGPPYPLDTSKMSWSERRKAKKEAKKEEKRQRIIAKEEDEYERENPRYDSMSYSGNRIRNINAKAIPKFSKLDWNDFDKDRDILGSSMLGFKAIQKTRYGVDGSSSLHGTKTGLNPTKSDLQWFIFEDQTIGLPMVSYLVYKGASKKEIVNFLDKTYNDPKRQSDKYAYEQPYFDVGMCWGRKNSQWHDAERRKDTEEYINECIKIRDGKNK